MSLNELQSWLLQDGIREELAAITLLTVRGEIDNLAPEPDMPSGRTMDWPRLLLAGSVLARTEERVGQEAALRIATAALSLSEERPVRDAGAVLLGKLSNFRAVGLAASRDLIDGGLDGRLGVALRLEAQRRELNRSILVESKGAWLQVNDFQQRFWNRAAEASWLSASAPTASGKTFLVLQWLVDLHRARRNDRRALGEDPLPLSRGRRERTGSSAEARRIYAWCRCELRHPTIEVG